MSKYMSFILDRIGWSLRKRHGKVLWYTFECNFSKSTFLKLSSTTFPKPALLNSIIYLHDGVAMPLAEIWALPSLKKKKNWQCSVDILIRCSWLRCWVCENFWPNYWFVLLNENTTCNFLNNGVILKHRNNIAQAQVKYLCPVVDI